MIFEVLTIFPEIVENYLSNSMMKRATQAGAVEFHVRNIRDYATDKHQMTDDTPFGGGPGMVMKAEPVAGAIEAALAAHTDSSDFPVIYLSPQGETWNQALAEELARVPGMILICGRYEGLDERVVEKYVTREISIGDYVLTGGELGALVMMDSIARLVPGVLGNSESALQDSFSNDGLLDHPHYTRPENWEGIGIPEVLKSGHHANISNWRRKMALKRTRDRRPDLFRHIEPNLTKNDRKLLAKLDQEAQEPPEQT